MSLKKKKTYLKLTQGVHNLHKKITREEEQRLMELLMLGMKPEMVNRVKSTPELFDLLLKGALDLNPKLGWRSAWLLWDCMEYNDPRIHDILPELFAKMSEFPDNQQWNLLMVLHRLQVPEKWESKLFDYCLKIFTLEDKKPAFRYNAWKFMLQMAQKHNELWQEVAWVSTPEMLESLSPGVRHSIKMQMLKFEKKYLLHK